MIDTVIKIEDLKKSFGNHEVLKGVNLEVGKGEVVSIIGASGSGKSTMLRCINLLERPTSGKISYLGEDILAPAFNTTAYRTKVGMVFQHFNLFNNMNVLKNCVVGQTTVLKRTKAEAEEKARKYLEMVGMSEFINARPFGRAKTEGRHCPCACNGA